MNVLFWGNYIPLQGAEYIVRAAALLRDRSDITFTMIGDGQTHDEVVSLAVSLGATNVRFIGRIPMESLPSHISKADVCLGIFGNTEKARLVIPNKAFEAIAVGKPLITADTPAARELFTDRENALLCRIADAEDLAAKIRLMRDDPELRRRIAAGGLQLYREKCTPHIIGAALLKSL